MTISKGDYYEENEWNDTISAFYIVTNSLAAFISFLAVVHGTQKYSYYNNLPAEMMDQAIAHGKQWMIAPMVYIAIIFQGLGVTFGVYLLFGPTESWLCSICAVIAFIFLGWFSRLQIQSYNSLDMTAGIIAANKSKRDLDVEDDGGDQTKLESS